MLWLTSRSSLLSQYAPVERVMSSLNADLQEVELGAYGARSVKKVQVSGERVRSGE